MMYNSIENQMKQKPTEEYTIKKNNLEVDTV